MASITAMQVPVNNTNIKHDLLLSSAFSASYTDVARYINEIKNKSVVGYNSNLYVSAKGTTLNDDCTLNLGTYILKSPTNVNFFNQHFNPMNAAATALGSAPNLPLGTENLLDQPQKLAGIIGGNLKVFGNIRHFEANFPVVSRISNSTSYANVGFNNGDYMFKISNSPDIKIISVNGFKGVASGFNGLASPYDYTTSVTVLNIGTTPSYAFTGFDKEKNQFVPIQFVPESKTGGTWLKYMGPNLWAKSNSISTSDTKMYYAACRMYVNATWIEQ